MGRCPLAIPLAVLIPVIMICDFCGLLRPQEPPFYGRAEYVARLVEVDEANTSGLLALAVVDSVDGLPVRPFKAFLDFINETPRVRAGETVRFRADMRPLPPVPDIPDVIDLRGSMRLEGVTATAAVVADSIGGIRPTGGLRAALLRANDDVLTRLRSAPLNDATIDMLAAMLLGKGSLMQPPVREVYSAAGLAHLLALSGMHVGVIAMIISLMLWPLYLTRHTRARLVSVAAALWCYAAFTGFIPSVTRAVIMASVYLASKVMQRRSVPLNSLCLAALLILLFRPADLFDVGFQMSFAAVAGIIIFFPLINRVDRRTHPRLYLLASYPVLSVSAVILSGPVAACHFHSFPLLFVVSNLIVAPLVPLLICSGIFSVVFSAGGATDFLAGLIDRVAGFTAGIPGATLTGLYPSAAATVALTVALGLTAIFIHGRKHFAAGVAAVAVACTASFMIWSRRPEYAAEEVIVDRTTRSTQLIWRQGRECVIFTNAVSAPDRREIHELYSLLLTDYMALRGIDSLRLMPGDARWECVTDAGIFIADLDSCRSGVLALRPKEAPGGVANMEEKP